MQGRNNIDYAKDGQLVTIGRMKGNISPSDKIYKLESKTLLTKVKSSYLNEYKKHCLFCKIEIRKNSPIIAEVYDKNNINLKGLAATASHILLKYFSCAIDKSIIFRPCEAYSFTTAFTVEDFPVPLSPYNNIWFANLPCKKESVFDNIALFCLSYPFKSERRILSD